jgi:methylmalonyl-CoA epimerase
MSEAGTPAARPPIGPIDHVAIVVRSIEQALPRYATLFGVQAGPSVAVEAQGVRVCFLQTADAPSSRLELIEPIVPDTGVARFLAERGEGLHHVCFRTRAIEDQLAALAAAGAELIDPQPRRGAEGRVAFVHPRTLNGVLWELLEPDA